MMKTHDLGAPTARRCGRNTRPVSGLVLHLHETPTVAGAAQDSPASQFHPIPAMLYSCEI